MNSATVDRVLEEVKTLTAGEQQQVRALLDSLLEIPAVHTPQMSEDEFLQMLRQKGIISNIPNPASDEEEDNEFEPVEIQGQPLSATVIEERR